MMSDISTTEDRSLQLQIRDQIQEFEQDLAALPNAVHGDNEICPLKHSFANGIYMREIRIPAGMVLTGKIHRHAHPNVLMEGEVLVVTEQNGLERLKGPMAMISEGKTKRALVALTDLHWITFHNVGDERDLQKIEQMIIAPTYKELEEQV